VWDNPFDGTNPISIEHSELTIPLLTSGMNIFLDTCTPTLRELDSCPHIELTCDGEWNPQTVCLVSTQRVEAEARDITDKVELGLLQISATAMAESLRAVASKRDVPRRRAFVSYQ
jgi:hypothetical protein